MPRGIRSLLIIGAVTLLAGYPLPSGAQQIDSAIWSNLPYRYIGPVGNRVISVVGIPDQPFTYYVGGASGGIWKTTDGGTYWEPIFDDQSVSSIGALAIPPTDPNIVWAGTGESFIRSNISIGNGGRPDAPLSRAGLYGVLDHGRQRLASIAVNVDPM
ncbi:MAG: hypothetical protein IID05_11915, partial [Gemmatimonadetes bacterium]|nr:hypothetical protein [Gemmatimonadota bacterium]